MPKQFALLIAEFEGITQEIENAINEGMTPEQALRAYGIFPEQG